jgi:hypothetical protein
MDMLQHQVLRMASRCGDCGRLFEDCPGEYISIRQGPARLICQDCKLREPPPSQGASE